MLSKIVVNYIDAFIWAKDWTSGSADLNLNYELWDILEQNAYQIWSHLNGVSSRKW